MATKKRRALSDNNGRVYIKASFNNTIITITDTKGNAISWSTSGSGGFRGTKKGTPFAAQIAAGVAAKRAVEQGLRYVSVYVKGPGPGREMAIRELQNSGLVVTAIKDVTPVPHNGCRPRKPRRV